MAEVLDGSLRVALVNLGCRVNRVELDVMALALQERGCALVGQREADAIVINTCAVTAEAQAKTRKAVRHAAHLPQQPLVVATGCVANLFADELTQLGDNVYVEPSKAQVPDRVVSMAACRVRAGSPQERSRAQTGHATPTGRTRPGIKVQDGCDNRCSFCIVWKARGHSRSVALPEVLAQVRAAQMRGAREVVLTGINLGNYRSEHDGRVIALPGLLDVILTQTDVGRIRLSSIEPPDVNQELLGVMAQAKERVAPFLHVCLQAGCNRTLSAMRRVYDCDAYARMVDAARTALPDVALGTDIIVGFPGETDEDFCSSLSFCERMAFARMHVFRYSKRPGTPAAVRPDQVEPATIARRSASMLELARQMHCKQAAARKGHEELVIVQEPGHGVTGGLFDALVDDALPVGSLERVVVSSVRPDGTLDARSCL